MSLISIIIPVYNAEKSLKQCIASILDQNFSQFELILINDGSIDSSKEICEDHAKHDSRVIVINKENGGVSSARNAGIRAAKGQNIIFCDADDLVLPGTLSHFMSFTNYDFVLASYAYSPSGKNETFEDLSLTEIQEIGSFIRENIFKGFSTPWAKMFKTNIIKENNIYFESNISSGEDTLWVNEYATCINSLRVSSYIVYSYQEDLSTLSKKGISEATLHHSITKLDQVVDSLEVKFSLNYEQFRQYQKLYFFNRYVGQIAISSIRNIYRSLKRISFEPSLNVLFVDPQNVIKKGLRLRVFNQLMNRHHFVLLACIVKLTKRYV